jgi:prepilin-type N-terminal cleavage/methylation domain-containing protein
MKVLARSASRRTDRGGSRRSHHNSQAGLSLVEVMVAIVVLLVASSAAFMSQLTSMRMIHQSRDIAVAMSDLEACMDGVRSSPVDGLAVAGSDYEHGESVAQYADLHLRGQRLVVTYPGYVAGAPLPDPLQVLISATWTPDRGGQITQTLRTVRVR